MTQMICQGAIIPLAQNGKLHPDLPGTFPSMKRK